MFYNDEVKQRFLNEVYLQTNSYRLAVSTFRSLHQFEAEFDKDICTMEGDELMYSIGETSGFRVSSKRSKMTILREYARWCIDNNIENCNDSILKIDEKEIGLEKFRRQMLSSPMHLQMFLDNIYHPEDMGTAGCIHRAWYWLAYAGVKEEDILKIRAQDIDFENMLIHYNGKDYPIYREAIKSLKFSANADKIRYLHPLYQDKVVYKDRYDGDEIIRLTKPKTLQQLRNEISRYQRLYRKDSSNKMLNLNMSYIRVMLSGMFYEKHLEESAGVKIDFMQEAADFMEGKEYNLSSSRNLIGAKQRKIASDYMIDYMRWKEAFLL